MFDFRTYTELPNRQYRVPNTHMATLSVHLVTARANLLTDQTMSGRPVLAKHQHFKTICEHTSDNSPIDSTSSFLN